MKKIKTLAMDNSGSNDTLPTIEATYNPYEHRNIKKPVSDTRALANLLKASMGSGVLAMPLAFNSAGIITGTLGTLIIGYICTHCIQIFVNLSKKLCCISKKPSLTYGETCGLAFLYGPKRLNKYANFIRHFSDVGVALTSLSLTFVYVVLLASSMEQLIRVQYTYNMNLSTYYFILLIPLILIVQINNLKHLAPFSAISNVLLIAVCGISFYFIFDEMPSFENRNLFADIGELPLFLSAVIMAIEGIACVMPIENEMLHPSHFLGCPGVLNISMIIVVFLHGSLGFFGYLKYGPNALGSITLNLDMNSMAAIIAKICIIIVIYFTYPLQFYVPAKIFWNYLKPIVNEKYQRIVHFMFLTVGVIFTVAIGMAIPKIGVLIEIAGAVFFTTFGLFMPALIEIIFQWEKNLGYLKWRLWKNALIMLFAVIALIGGVVHAILELMK